MNFDKSEEELRILTDTYHEEIMQMGDVQINKYVNSDMLWDSNWDSLRHEPVFQLLYYDADDEINDTDQFMIAYNSKFFSRDGAMVNELNSMYNFSVEETENLFKLYITDFLSSAPLASPLQVWETMEFNKYIIDIMFEVDYFSRMDKEEIKAIFDLTRDTRFLDSEVKDVFVF